MERVRIIPRNLGKPSMRRLTRQYKLHQQLLIHQVKLSQRLKRRPNPKRVTRVRVLIDPPLEPRDLSFQQPSHEPLSIRNSIQCAHQRQRIYRAIRAPAMRLEAGVLSKSAPFEAPAPEDIIDGPLLIDARPVPNHGRYCAGGENKA